MTTPPGWYEGGVPGEQRWWDGVGWTAYARPTPTVGPATPSTFWSGSKDGSLIGAILLAVIAIPTFFIAVFTTVTAGLVGALPGLAFLAFAAFAVILFLNWNGLRKNEQIRARQQGVQPQVVPRPPGS